MIRVENKRTFVGTGVYVGRPSALGNRFKIGADGTRSEVIAKYKRWLWRKWLEQDKAVVDAVNALVEKAKRDEDLMLVCWCAPDACHADVLKAFVEWRLRQ